MVGGGEGAGGRGLFCFQSLCVCVRAVGAWRAGCQADPSNPFTGVDFENNGRFFEDDEKFKNRGQI